MWNTSPVYYYFCSRSACAKCLCKSSLWGVFSKFRKYIFNLLFLQQYIEHLSNLRHIEIKTPGCAEFEFEMDLKDPNAKIFLLKVKQYIHFWLLHFAVKNKIKSIYKTYTFFCHRMVLWFHLPLIQMRSILCVKLEGNSSLAYMVWMQKMLDCIKSILRGSMSSPLTLKVRFYLYLSIKCY